jgi:hypothetical protein
MKTGLDEFATRLRDHKLAPGESQALRAVANSSDPLDGWKIDQMSENYEIKVMDGITPGEASRRVTISGPREGVLDLLYHDNPELLTVAKKYFGTHDLPHPTNVAEVLALRDLWALTLSHVSDNVGPLVGNIIPVEQYDGDEAEKKIRVDLARNVHDAVPYLWNADLFLTASSIRLPAHVVGQRLPTPLVWLTFDRRLQSFPGITAEDDLECAGILLAEGSTQAGAWFIRGSMDTGTVIYPRKLLFGAHYPEEVDESWRSILAALSFMTSPYVVEQRRGLSRNERRRMGLGRAEDEPDSRLPRYIDLRPPQAGETSDAERVQSGDVQWKCRWLVRCHQRAHWYPKTQAHKIIWISPYIKGPEEAPRKTRVYRVVR